MTNSTETASKVSVDAAALRIVLLALIGPAHHIRELQAMRNPILPNNPIDLLVREFNEQVAGESQ